MLPSPPTAEALSVLAASPRPKAAIIDDAFDDVEAGEIAVTAYLEFEQVANEEGRLDQLLEELHLVAPVVYPDEAPSAEFLTFLQQLWLHRRTNEQLRLLVDDRLFRDKVDKLNALETICRNLEGSDIDVERIDSRVEDVSMFTSGDFVYVFMDYNLGIQPGPAAVANAKAKAREIYNNCPAGKKPVTVLMSSEPNIQPLIERFQQETDMLEGVFRFSPKEQLQDSQKFSLLIRAYRQEFANSHALQDYIHSLIKAAKEAQHQFEQEVRSLRIEDYAFIQNAVLRTEAQPLGDYLAWLYGAHWTNLLLRNAALREQQTFIDKVFADKPPLYHRPPSPILATIYMSALFEENLGPIELHPMEKAGNSPLAKLPYLHLGDLFTKSGNTSVWMVLNAQCDLERPKAETADRSILLLRGTLVPFDKNALKDHKTELFFFEEKTYRIKWNVKQVDTVAHDKLLEWQESQGVERRFRLRLPFALELQQAFSASLTRVGLPVSPPLTQDLQVEVLFHNQHDTVEVFLPARQEYAFLPVTRGDNKMARLTLNFALDFKEALLNRQRELRTALTGQEQHNALFRKALSKVEALLANFDDWFFEKTEFTYPINEKNSWLFPNLVGLMLNADKTKLPAQATFVLNIVTTESAPATTADQS